MGSTLEKKKESMEDFSGRLLLPSSSIAAVSTEENAVFCLNMLPGNQLLPWLLLSDHPAFYALKLAIERKELHGKAISRKSFQVVLLKIVRLLILDARREHLILETLESKLHMVFEGDLL